MRLAMSISTSRGVKSARRLTKLKRVPRTSAACMSRNSASVTLRLTVATPRALPLECCKASTSARLSVPWQVACTITLRAKPRWSRSANSCSFEASHGVYLRSGAYGNSAPGPNTWQCASTAPAGTCKAGFDGLAYQSSQPGVFVNSIGASPCFIDRPSGLVSRSPTDFREEAVRLDAPISAARELRRPAGPEQPLVGQVGDPGLTLGRARCRPRRQADLAHRLRNLPHFLAAAPSVLDHALEEVGALPLPVD